MRGENVGRTPGLTPGPQPVTEGVQVRVLPGESIPSLPVSFQITGIGNGGTYLCVLLRLRPQILQILSPALLLGRVSDMAVAPAGDYGLIRLLPKRSLNSFLKNFTIALSL